MIDKKYLALGLIPMATVAHAEIYMSQDQAAALIFPGLKLRRTEIILTEDQANKIEKASDQNIRNKNLVVYEGPKKEVVFIDQVLGKHEYITYAVGVDGDSKVRGIEVVEYRETYGNQVKNADWRQQFTGKSAKDSLKLGKDIKNIAGATLSSSHITAGVRRLLLTYGLINESL